MTIVIPMAGLSSRFAKAGFTLPKYMLYINDKSLFNLAVSSFEDYFQTCRFVFVARDVFDTPSFIEKECKLMGIKKYKVVVTEPTKGQAETVLFGIKGADIPEDEEILIFNIDTFRPGFKFPNKAKLSDGYLECFIGDGDNWSYAKTEDGTDDTKVIETAEKKSISHFCSTGIYFFKNASDFILSYMSNAHNNDGKEQYVAPLYNYLIKKGRDIRVNIIDKKDVCFCGIPSEYYEYLKNNI